MFIGHEIIDVENASGGEIFKQAKAGYRSNRAAVVEESETITAILLAADPRDEIRFGEMWPEFAHDREARANLAVGLGEPYLVRLS